MLGLDPTKVVSASFKLKVWAAIFAGSLLLLAAVSAASMGFGYFRGQASKQAELTAFRDQVAREKLDAQRQLNELNRKTREQERLHEQEVSNLRARYTAQSERDKAADARTVRDLLAGTERLRFQVRSCRAAGSAEAGTAAPGAEGPATAELAPETSAALYGIAAEGDAAINQLNALNDWADAAVKLCNGTENAK